MFDGLGDIHFEDFESLLNREVMKLIREEVSFKKYRDLKLWTHAYSATDSISSITLECLISFKEIQHARYHHPDAFEIHRQAPRRNVIIRISFKPGDTPKGVRREP